MTYGIIQLKNGKTKGIIKLDSGKNIKLSPKEVNNFENWIRLNFTKKIY